MGLYWSNIRYNIGTKLFHSKSISTEFQKPISFGLFKKPSPSALIKSGKDIFPFEFYAIKIQQGDLPHIILIPAIVDEPAV